MARTLKQDTGPIGPVRNLLAYSRIKLPREPFPANAAMALGRVKAGYNALAARYPGERPEPFPLRIRGYEVRSASFMLDEINNPERLLLSFGLRAKPGAFAVDAPDQGFNEAAGEALARDLASAVFAFSPLHPFQRRGREGELQWLDFLMNDGADAAAAVDHVSVEVAACLSTSRPNGSGAGMMSRISLTEG